ncbi:MAG: hypothetical protein J5533_07505 [Bacteroidales bacterium]|nr:hypothetical protein [Bacteroidales bacterium]
MAKIFSFCKYWLAAASLLVFQLPNALAQEVRADNMPEEVYYLMPSFQNGTVYFHGKSPAQGKLNICAVDNTLRFLDNSGTELAAGQGENIFRVKIDTVMFLQYQNVFYRMFPVSMDMGVAQRRDVVILKDAKQGAYGTVSQTNAIREYGTLYADGIAYNLNQAKQYPYRMSESLFIYYGDDIYPVNKKSLRKLFPDKKAEIDARFKSSEPIPDDIPGLQALLTELAQ